MPKITIYDLIVAKLGLDPETTDSISGAQAEEAGFALIGGCVRCGATLGAHNGFPTRIGYWACRDCCPDDAGFSTPEEFFAWDADEQPERDAGDVYEDDDRLDHDPERGDAADAEGDEDGWDAADAADAIHDPEHGLNTGL